MIGPVDGACAGVHVRVICIELNSMWNNTTGYWNTAVGTGSLQSNTTAFDNTAIGYVALVANTTGSYNTAYIWWRVIHRVSAPVLRCRIVEPRFNTPWPYSKIDDITLTRSVYVGTSYTCSSSSLRRTSPKWDGSHFFGGTSQLWSHVEDLYEVLALQNATAYIIVSSHTQSTLIILHEICTT